MSDFWQSLPQYNASGSRPHEIDITPEDWRVWFSFPQSISVWDQLPKEETTPEPVNRFNVIGVLFWAYAVIAAAFVIWHFV